MCFLGFGISLDDDGAVLFPEGGEIRNFRMSRSWEWFVRSPQSPSPFHSLDYSRSLAPAVTFEAFPGVSPG